MRTPRPPALSCASSLLQVCSRHRSVLRPRYNANAGNGIGESQLPRHLGGGRYTAPPPAESHAIVNAYTLAFFDRYLRGAVARDGWLAENHYGDAVVLEAKTG